MLADGVDVSGAKEKLADVDSDLERDRLGDLALTTGPLSSSRKPRKLWPMPGSSVAERSALDRKTVVRIHPGQFESNL